MHRSALVASAGSYRRLLMRRPLAICHADMILAADKVHTPAGRKEAVVIGDGTTPAGGMREIKRTRGEALRVITLAERRFSQVSMAATRILHWSARTPSALSGPVSPLRRQADPRPQGLYRSRSAVCLMCAERRPIYTELAQLEEFERATVIRFTEV
jgi:hypothetical protein